MKKLLLLTLAIATLTSLGYSQTVTFGTKVWTSKNLDVATYRNGDIIPQVQEKEAWDELTTGAWCYYDNDTANGAKYGKLYNFYAVNDPRGLAPKGWHIPSDKEWGALILILGGKGIAGAKMKSKSGWKEDGNGTNSSGFSALPGGIRFNYGIFREIGETGGWWSSTELSNSAWPYYLNYKSSNVFRNNNSKANGKSVRCIKN